MNVIAMRTAAFVVGSMIAGCVYATSNASGPAHPESIAPVSLYPGAHHTSGDPNGDGADVTVHSPMVVLHIRAARFASRDAPARVVAFYRAQLAKLGPVSQSSRGPHTDVEGFHWVDGPGQTTLHAARTIVAIKPRTAGTEFAYIQIDVAAEQSPPPGH